jgi:cyclopropane fatty-acyl-phospholipid synthase-like methyltransferase
LLNQAVRYQELARIVEAGPGPTLLEVGSGSRGIATYLSSPWRVTACDRDFSDYGARRHPAGDEIERVIGDALALPFDDRSFDVAVSLDMLEHIPSDLRGQALRELVRVSRRAVVVGCPCGAPALAADRRLARFYGRVRRPVPAWLREHLDNGLPEPHELEQALIPHGSVSVLPNESVRSHERLAKLEAIPVLWRVSPLASALVMRASHSRRSPLRSVGAALGFWLRGRDRLPSYRTIAVLLLDRQD